MKALPGEATERVTCEVCGENTSKNYVFQHKKRPKHIAAINRQKMIAEHPGRTAVTSGSLASKLAVLCNMNTHAAQTDVMHEGRGARLQTQHWLPTWFVTLFNNHEAYGDGHSGTVMELFKPIVLEALESKEARDGLLTVYRLAGHKGISGLALTPKIRADKLRERANDVMKEVLRLRKQADEIDPPEVPE